METRYLHIEKEWYRQVYGENFIANSNIGDGNGRPTTVQPEVPQAQLMLFREAPTETKSRQRFGV